VTKPERGTWNGCITPPRVKHFLVWLSAVLKCTIISLLVYFSNFFQSYFQPLSLAYGSFAPNPLRGAASVLRWETWGQRTCVPRLPLLSPQQNSGYARSVFSSVVQARDETDGAVNGFQRYGAEGRSQKIKLANRQAATRGTPDEIMRVCFMTLSLLILSMEGTGRDAVRL